MDEYVPHPDPKMFRICLCRIVFDIPSRMLLIHYSWVFQFWADIFHEKLIELRYISQFMVPAKGVQLSRVVLICPDSPPRKGHFSAAFEGFWRARCSGTQRNPSTFTCCLTIESGILLHLRNCVFWVLLIQFVGARVRELTRKSRMSWHLTTAWRVLQLSLLKILEGFLKYGYPKPCIFPLLDNGI